MNNNNLLRRCAKMIDFKKVFVDTSPFIYFIEKDINNPQYPEKVKSFFYVSFSVLL